MAGSRSSNARLLAVGFAVLVIGVVLVLIIIRNSDDPAATPAPVSTQTDQADAPTEQRTLSPQQLSTARLPLPLEVPEGTEAVAVRANFMRSVAAIPTPGDLVSLYRLPAPAAPEEGGGTQPSGATLPDVGPDAEPLLAESEVLAVTGPLPASNDGTITLVVAVPSADVPEVMPVANQNQVWFTLLPAPAEEATAEPTEDNS